MRVEGRDTFVEFFVAKVATRFDEIVKDKFVKSTAQSRVRKEVTSTNWDHGVDWLRELESPGTQSAEKYTNT